MRETHFPYRFLFSKKTFFIVTANIIHILLSTLFINKTYKKETSPIDKLILTFFQNIYLFLTNQYKLLFSYFYVF